MEQGHRGGHRGGGQEPSPNLNALNAERQFSMFPGAEIV